LVIQVEEKCHTFQVDFTAGRQGNWPLATYGLRTCNTSTLKRQYRTYGGYRP